MNGCNKASQSHFNGVVNQPLNIFINVFCFVLFFFGKMIKVYALEMFGYLFYEKLIILIIR